MDKIQFVVTPPCRYCIPCVEYNRRLSCIGCTKLRFDKVVTVRASLTKHMRKQRSAEVAELRKKGMTLKNISIKLRMPRSTIQSILEKQ